MLPQPHAVEPELLHPTYRFEFQLNLFLVGGDDLIIMLRKRAGVDIIWQLAPRMASTSMNEWNVENFIAPPPPKRSYPFLVR